MGKFISTVELQSDKVHYISVYYLVRYTPIEKQVTQNKQVTSTAFVYQSGFLLGFHDITHEATWLA